MRSLLRGIVGAVGIELRRPASWLACAGGMVAGLAASLRGPSAAAMAVGSLVGSLLAVSSLGELPCGLFHAVRWRSAEAVVWTAARSVFPLAGVAAASICVGGKVAGEGTVAILAILATACVQALAHVAGGRGSEPATAALLAGISAAAAAAWGVPGPWLVPIWACAAIAIRRLARIVVRQERIVVPRGRGRTVWLWPLPAQGRLRPSMTAAAMVAGIAAMAAWLVPQPPSVDRYAAMAAAVFVALAVPQMTLADGIVDRAGWAAVLRPSGRAVAMGMGWPPSGRIALAHAAMFVWPLVVAGVLAVRLPGAAVVAASAVVALVAVAAVTAALAVAIRRVGGSAETAQAVVLVFIALACGSCHLADGGFFPVVGGLLP